MTRDAQQLEWRDPVIDVLDEARLAARALVIAAVAARLLQADALEEVLILAGMSDVELNVVAHREAAGLSPLSPTGNPHACAPIATHGVSGSIGLTKEEAA